MSLAEGEKHFNLQQGSWEFFLKLSLLNVLFTDRKIWDCHDVILHPSIPSF